MYHNIHIQSAKGIVSSRKQKMFIKQITNYSIPIASLYISETAQSGNYDMSSYHILHCIITYLLKELVNIIISLAERVVVQNKNETSF